MHTPILEREHPVSQRRKGGDPGIQRVYRFPNGYGASVVRFTMTIGDGEVMSGSYGSTEGLWELGVLKFHGPEPDDFHLTYDTPIVLGYLTDEQVEQHLAEIEALPNA